MALQIHEREGETIIITAPAELLRGFGGAAQSKERHALTGIISLLIVEPERFYSVATRIGFPCGIALLLTKCCQRESRQRSQRQREPNPAPSYRPAIYTVL